MVSKSSRIPSTDLKDTRGFNKKSSPFFLVSFRSNQLSHSRFAVVASAKVDRRSVIRHRLKRRVYERLRLWPGVLDVVVTVLPAAKTLSRKEFISELEKILPK